MSHLVALIKSLFPHVPSQKERDVAYLNQSTDIYDIERRPRHTFGLTPGFQQGAR
jgi:Protein of unknown function (DUF3563)